MIKSNFSVSEFSSLSAIKAQVDIYRGDAYEYPELTCTCGEGEGIGAGALEHFTISREGEMGKFFGFGVSHKLNMNLIDFGVEPIVISPSFVAKIAYGDGTKWDSPYPTLYFTEVKTDRKNHTIAITAYDKLQQATEYQVSELDLPTPYTLREAATAAATLLGLEIEIVNGSNWDLDYPEGANFATDADLRAFLDDIAETSYTIYYINSENKLVFKTWGNTKNPQSVATLINKDAYYEFETEDYIYLNKVAHCTALGDNVETLPNTTILTDGYQYVTQYMWDNGFLDMREDLSDILWTAPKRDARPFTLDWSGDYRYEIGDKATVNCPEATEAYTRAYDIVFVSDVIEYAGYISEKTEWSWDNNSASNSATPASVGDKINQTVAKVDKINKEISLVVEDTTETKEVTNQLVVDTKGISATVYNLEQTTRSSIDSLSESVETLTKQVSLAITQDDVTIAVNKALTEGVDKVTTSSKKYTFDDTGLNITSGDSSISTMITEDGMQISRGSNKVLTASNEGVEAEDLHATTYLIIGDNSRFENWTRNNKQRTACFWIGG